MALTPELNRELRLSRRPLLALCLTAPLILALTGFYLNLQRGPAWPLPVTLPVQRGPILASEGTVLAEGAADSRRYPQGHLAANVVGFSGALQPDGRYGLEGLEYSLDARLQLGETVRVTIDPVLQAAAERHLFAAAREYEAASGTVVILEAGSGRILAAASFPTYNPADDRSTREPEQLANRVFMEAYEPGSVIKPFVIAALLEERRLSTNEIVPAEMSLTVGDQTFHDVSRHDPVLSVPDILRYSSNSAMIHLADRLNPAELHSWLAEFGFGQDLPVEGTYTRSGVLNAWEDWVPQDHASVTIGQSISTTVLQLAVAYSIFTNRGFLILPRLLEVAEERQPRRVLSPTVAEAMRSMLVYTVEESGLRDFRLLNIQTAGKTGTADIFDHEVGRYLESAYALTFAGIFPAEAPRITMVVSLQRPKEGSTSMAVAAPLFRNIGSEVAAHLGITPGPEALVRQ